MTYEEWLRGGSECQVVGYGVRDSTLAAAGACPSAGSVWRARNPLFRSGAIMRGLSYCVYIMSSPSRTLYTGVTNDLERRITEHRHAPPEAFVARYRLRLLAYFEEYSDVNQAIAREKEIKRMTRRRKLAIIESANPEWKDLSAGS